jgi:hypothetical protein
MVGYPETVISVTLINYSERERERCEVGAMLKGKKTRFVNLISENYLRI